MMKSIFLVLLCSISLNGCLSPKNEEEKKKGD